MSVSHRIVGASSRRGGGLQHGVVHVQRSRIVECRDCGAGMLDVVAQGSHALRPWRRPDGTWADVNCIGTVVSRSS